MEGKREKVQRQGSSCPPPRLSQGPSCMHTASSGRLLVLPGRMQVVSSPMIFGWAACSVPTNWVHQQRHARNLQGFNSAPADRAARRRSTLQPGRHMTEHCSAGQQTSAPPALPHGALRLLLQFSMTIWLTTQGVGRGSRFREFHECPASASLPRRMNHEVGGPHNSNPLRSALHN
jgi:hypothetical protein